MSEVMTTTAATEAWPKDRKPPVIDPNWCTLDSEGQCFRWWQIRLPETATLADLNETPAIWRLLQASGKALRVDDRLYIISYDDSWAIDALATEATSTIVTLSLGKRYDRKPRHDRLPQDDTYAVRWCGNGYAVERKRDKLRVSAIVQTAAEATRELQGKYSRPVQ